MRRALTPKSISTAHLNVLGACPNGIAAFRALFGDRAPLTTDNVTLAIDHLDGDLLAWFLTTIHHTPDTLLAAARRQERRAQLATGQLLLPAVNNSGPGSGAGQTRPGTTDRSVTE